MDSVSVRLELTSITRSPDDSMTKFLNAQGLAALLAAQHPFKNHARHEDRRKQVGQQTKRQRGRKPLDRPCAEDEQDCGRNNCGYVRIHNRDPGMAESLIYSRRRRLAVA